MPKLKCKPKQPKTNNNMITTTAMLDVNVRTCNYACACVL